MGVTVFGARRRLAPRYKKIKAIAAAAFSIGVLIVAVAFVVSYVRNGASLSRFESAPSCGLSDAVSNTCRYVGTATIVKIYQLDREQVVVAFDSIPGRTFNTSFPVDGAPAAGTISQGGTATVEVYNGRITRLAGAFTFDIPSQRPTTTLLEAAAALAALGLFMLLLSSLMVRDAWGSAASTRS